MRQLCDKNGFLTVYGLSLGYCHREAISNGRRVEVTLWREHSIYHVRAYDFENHKRLDWECFHSLPQARKAYTLLSNRYHKVVGATE